MASERERADGPTITFNVSGDGLFKVAAFVAGIAALYALREVVLVVLAAVIIAAAIDPMTRALQRGRFPIPRTFAVLTIYLAGAGIFVLLSTQFAPTFVGEARALADRLPGLLQTLGETKTIGSLPAVPSILDSLGAEFAKGNLLAALEGPVSGATYSVFATASAFFGGLLSFALIVVLSFYLAAQERGVENFLRIVVPLRHEAYALDLWKRAQRKIGLWMQGQLILGVLVGLMTYLALVLVGALVGQAVPSPLLLALLAGILELVPVVGPILAAIPAVALSLSAGGTTLGLAVLAVYALVQQFENNLLQPLVVKKIVGIPSVVAILALVVGAKLAGFIGMLLSVPLAAVLMELLADFERRKLAEMERESAGK
jgi:predicted PurR-regulated permease PerM